LQEFIQTLVNGLTTGCIYALIALGYTMVYGILKLLNFAHGDIYMIGAYIGYFVMLGFGGPSDISVPVALMVVVMMLAAALGSGFLGVGIERFAYRPLRDAPRIAPLITALGVSFVLENVVLLFFGGYIRSYSTPSYISFTSGIHIDGVTITIVDLLIFGVTALMMVGLQLIVKRTTLGRSMRAVASDREAAEMIGINVDRTIAMTFFIGSAMAGVAGVLAGLAFSQIINTMGFLAGLKAFTAAVVGGIGSIPGAMLGGILIGLCEAFCLTYISIQFSDLIVFGILILTMLVRPTGILGQKALQKV
jgi:branched-chain amino acid transport system permease protein